MGKEALFSFEPALKHPIAMAAEEYGSFRVGSSAETLVFDDVAQDASRLLLSQEEENIFGSDPLQTIDLVAEDISVQEAYLIEGENVVLEHLPVIEEQAQALDSTMAAIPVIHDVVDHEQSFDAGPSQQPDSFIVDDKPLSESIGDSIISCAIPNEVVVVESDEVSVRVKDEDFDIDAPAITVSADIHSLEEGFVAEAPSIVVPSGYPVDSPVLNDTQPTMEATPTTAAFDVIGNTLSFDEYRHSIEIDRHSIKVPSETYARSFVSSILNDDESPTVAAEHVSDMVDEYKPSLGGHLDNSPAETYERSYVSSIVVDDPSIEAIPIAASAEPDRMFADEDKLSPETTLGNLALMVDGESRSIDSRFADVGVSEVISFYRPPIYSNQNDSVSPLAQIQIPTRVIFNNPIHPSKVTYK
ncbi:hypothetical protein BC829DRAFT_242001 [Chytridium lagenaria]|nr:hypothetical protein BC829DRAFT_242001 [Chytridium lagenaria]